MLFLFLWHVYMQLCSYSFSILYVESVFMKTKIQCQQQLVPIPDNGVPYFACYDACACL